MQPNLLIINFISSRVKNRIKILFHKWVMNNNQNFSNRALIKANNSNIQHQKVKVINKTLVIAIEMKVKLKTIFNLKYNKRMKKIRKINYIM